MIDRTAKIKIIQLKDVVIAKRNGISARAYYCGCDFDVAKTIKRAIDLVFFCTEISKGNKSSADIELIKKFTFITLVLFGLSILIPLITVFI